MTHATWLIEHEFESLLDLPARCAEINLKYIAVELDTVPIHQNDSKEVKIRWSRDTDNVTSHDFDDENNWIRYQKLEF